MGILEQIHNLTNSALSTAHVGYHVWRGLMLPIDIFLTGSVRFARKVGNVLPTILPFNYSTLSQDTTLADRTIFLESFPTASITLGTRVRINRREILVVEDFNAENNELLLTTGIQASYPEGTPVEVYGQPIESDGSYSLGTTTINVDSPWKIYAGDVLVFTYTEVNVTAAVLTATVGTTYSYQITLETGVPYDVADGALILLRAYPAYESETKVVPTVPGVLYSSGIGPFVVDWVSGPLLTDTVADETMYIYLQTAAGTVIQEGIFDKNSLVLRAPIKADYPLFWDIEQGRINWDGTQFHAYTDDDGKFHIFKKLVPNFPVDQVNQWNIQVTPDADVNVFVQLEPNASQMYTLTGGVTTTINVLLPTTDEPVERVHLLVDSGSNDGVRVRFNDWNLITPRVETVKYNVVCRVTGDYNYACSGLFVKPMFYTIDLLKTRLDFTAALDGGRLLL